MLDFISKVLERAYAFSMWMIVAVALAGLFHWPKTHWLPANDIAYLYMFLWGLSLFDRRNLHRDLKKAQQQLELLRRK